MPEISETPPREPSRTNPVHPDDINRMVKNYRDSPSHDDDTQSVWFSIYELMALIGDNKANGVRIYYGRHEKDDKSYPGRHNVILVATRDSVNPANPACDTSIDLLTSEKNAGPAVNASFKGMGLDWGCLCPPRCTPPVPGSVFIGVQK